LNSSSSSSGKFELSASIYSASNCAICVGSIITSSGVTAGASTNDKLGSPTSLLNNHKYGFSNW